MLVMPGKNKKAKRNDGKHHEKKVDAAVRRLYPNNKVETNVVLPGAISGGKRQIDTLLHHPDGLTDFEAKDYARNVGIDTIANYGFKLEDEQVPHGVVVSNSPYAPTAVNTAKHYDVKLTHLIDTEDKESHFKVAQKALIEDTIVRSLSMGIRDNGFEPISVPINLGEAILVNKDDERLPAYNVFQGLWNEELCPSDDGQHTVTMANQKVVMTDGSVVAVTEFRFDYVVETIYRKGEWPIEKAMGLYNVTENSFTTHAVTSARLSTDEMNKWPQIDKEEANKTTFGMQLTVKSMLPDVPPPMNFD
jgi:hypothetical protein